MIVKALLKHAPVIGSLQSFVTTSIKVYNTTTPTQVATVAAKGIILECTFGE